MYAATIRSHSYWHSLSASSLKAAKREATRELGGSMYDGDMLVIARNPAPGLYIPISRRTARGRWHDDPAK